MNRSGDAGYHDQVIWRTTWFRLIGLLPLTFFIARLVEYVQVGTPSQVLWMCHLANLLLAIGLFTANPAIIRVSALLIVFGIPPWAVDMFIIKIITPVSIASHLGGTILSLLILEKVRMKPRIWIAGIILFLLVQQICRIFTPFDLDVNNAHKVYSIWKDMISNYWLYWVPSVFVVTTAMWVIEKVLLLVFPEKKNEEWRMKNGE